MQVMLVDACGIQRQVILKTGSKTSTSQARILSPCRGAQAVCVSERIHRHRLSRPAALLSGLPAKQHMSACCGMFTCSARIMRYKRDYERPQN